MMKVLVTGGAGYIGSTICSALRDNGHTSVILDSLITGRPEFAKLQTFYKGDIADSEIIEKIFADHNDITHIIHCAALIVVPESMSNPGEYYRENVSKSLEFFEILRKLGKTNIVFSSSASIYDVTSDFMVTELSPLKPCSPYARTKFMMESILEDFCNAYNMRGVSLRYFNPIGADPRMRTGIHVKEPSHVVGKLVDTAMKKQKEFCITGTDWPTRDGSGMRDYIHVWDLAMAHVRAMENFDNCFEESGKNKNYRVLNLGTGEGVTVKELVATFEKVYGRTLNKVDAAARPGDVAGSYANADLARKMIKWAPIYNLADGIRDAIKWGEVRANILYWPN